MVVCEEKKRVEKKREKSTFIILLRSLYYFVGLYVKNKN